MADYTYLAADTLTGNFRAELPLSNVSYDLRVNDAASFSAELPLKSVQGLWDVTTPARTSIYVVQGDTLQWGGILWGRRYRKSSKSFQLDGKDFLSYFDHLLITADLSFAQRDQLAIARSLADYGMNKGSSNLHLAYGGTNLSGILRDRVYLATDQAAIGQRLRELSAVDSGFDFRFFCQWDGGVARRTMQLGYPSLGRSYASSGLSFEYEADASDLTFDEDGEGSASTVYATGATPSGGTTPPSYTATNALVTAAGFPRLETSRTYSDISQLTTLTAHAKGELNTVQWPLQTMTLEVQGSSPTVPPLGSYLPGDEVRIRIDRGDDLWPFGALVLATITSVQVKPDDESNDSISIGLAPISITQGSA